MELILALAAAGPIGYFAKHGLALYLAAWALVLPVQTIIVFSEGDGEPTYWVVNAVVLTAGISLNRLGARLAAQRRGIARVAR